MRVTHRLYDVDAGYMVTLLLLCLFLAFAVWILLLMIRARRRWPDSLAPFGVSFAAAGVLRLAVPVVLLIATGQLPPAAFDVGLTVTMLAFVAVQFWRHRRRIDAGLREPKPAPETEDLPKPGDGES